MPPRRRRRKSIDDKKCELIFEESPKNIVHSIPSPVYCARCPPTADIVPVDDSILVPWVSPHFEGACVGQRKRHRSFTQNKTKNKSLHSKAHSMYDNAPNTKDQSMEAFRHKYKPLEFLMESTIEEPSSPEESEHVRRSSKDNSFNKSTFTKLRDIPMNSLSVCTTEVSDPSKDAANGAKVQLNYKERHLLSPCLKVTPLKKTSADCKVLVVDTPEPKTGVTRKFRMLDKLKKRGKLKDLDGITRI